MNGAASSAASSAASNAASNASSQAASNAASKSSAPKTSAPQQSAPQTTQTSAPTTAPSQSGSNLSGNASYQAQTNGYKPTGEITENASSSLPSNLQTEGGNAKPLEQMDADELQQVGVDTSEGGLDLPNQQQVSTPEGVTPDADELTPEQTQDPDVANSQKDPEQIQEQNEAAQAEADAQAEEEPQKGDKVDDGKQIGDEGQVEDTATKKTAKAAGRAVAAYFTKGESLKYDQAVLNNSAVDKTIGVVSDISDQVVPGLQQASEALDELEIPDVANNALDTVGSVLNKDAAGTVKNAKKTIDSVNKSKDKVKKKIIMWIVSAATTALIVVFLFLAVVGPIVGGVMNLTDKVVDLYNAVRDGIAGAFDDVYYGTLEYIDYQKILNEIPDYNKLSKNRKEVINIALSAVGGKYLFGGKATGPGLEGIPRSGIDCSGFVNWVYWTATGSNPGMGGTWNMVNSPTSKMRPIGITELKPGDIVVYNKGNAGHTGIYAGDGEFIHAAGKDYGIVKGKSKSLSNSANGLVYYRYAGIDD
jgi:hypothetical protein